MNALSSVRLNQIKKQIMEIIISHLKKTFDDNNPSINKVFRQDSPNFE